MLVVGFAIYMINGYVGRYLMYEWRTEIRHEEMSSIVQPVIVICSASAQQKFLSCYRNITFLFAEMSVLLTGQLVLNRSRKDNSVVYQELHKFAIRYYYVQTLP